MLLLKKKKPMWGKLFPQALALPDDNDTDYTL